MSECSRKRAPGRRKSFLALCRVAELGIVASCICAATNDTKTNTFSTVALEVLEKAGVTSRRLIFNTKLTELVQDLTTGASVAGIEDLDPRYSLLRPRSN